MRVPAGAAPPPLCEWCERRVDLVDEVLVGVGDGDHEHVHVMHRGCVPGFAAAIGMGGGAGRCAAGPFT